MTARVLRRTVLVLLALFIGAARMAAQDDASAEKAVMEWLSLVDHGRYAETWSSAASNFRQAVTQEKWEEAAQRVREPLGALKTRTVKGVTPTTSLPGAPDGQYVVFQFDASFEHKAAAIETVTAVLDTDGTWRVVGYFIR